ncbi:hypothetical protein A3L09_07570 [Thermococcus profundus]|uniref:Uncharacterized protein n=1 Tax=Thermococcus profundus TaxID=49899 RepID=A0A2Z2M9C1_THEPR|nr:hypothetical protein [Thermococcus profundus]ASJ03120.1 hypothetical protein A3L09_07570 [Thermococcus profundus]
MRMERYILDFKKLRSVIQGAEPEIGEIEVSVIRGDGKFYHWVRSFKGRVIKDGNMLFVLNNECRLLKNMKLAEAFIRLLRAEGELIWGLIVLRRNAEKFRSTRITPVVIAENLHSWQWYAVVDWGKFLWTYMYVHDGCIRLDDIIHMELGRSLERSATEAIKKISKLVFPCGLFGSDLTGLSSVFGYIGFETRIKIYLDEYYADSDEEGPEGTNQSYVRSSLLVVTSNREDASNLTAHIDIEHANKLLFQLVHAAMGPYATRPVDLHFDYLTHEYTMSIYLGRDYVIRARIRTCPGEDKLILYSISGVKNYEGEVIISRIGKIPGIEIRDGPECEVPTGQKQHIQDPESQNHS